MTEERSFTTPRGTTVRLLCRPGTNDAMMAESCIANDEYQLRDVTLGSGCAVDVGAHIGMGCIALALEHPAARILAVEPIPDNIELLHRNIALNGVADRITVLDGAAAAPGQKHVNIAYAFAGGEMQDMHRFIGNQPMPEGSAMTRLRARAVRMSDLRKQAGGSIDLLLIDCEGGEYQLLASPDVASVAEIRGEYHDGWERLAALLIGTHDLERTHGGEGFGGFTARLRA